MTFVAGGKEGRTPLGHLNEPPETCADGRSKSYQPGRVLSKAFASGQSLQVGKRTVNSLCSLDKESLLGVSVRVMNQKRTHVVTGQPCEYYRS